MKTLVKKYLLDFLKNKIDSDRGFREQIHASLVDFQLKRFGEDFSLDLVPSGFADRCVPKYDDKNTVERICKAYKLSKNAQSKMQMEFRESNEWSPIYESYLQTIVDALTSGDIETVTKSYRNFWRDSCSTGLIGLPLDMKKHFLSGEISKEHKELARRDNLWRMKLWQELSPGMSIDQLRSSDVGNPYGFFLNGSFFRSGCDYQNYYANYLSRLMGKNQRSVVCEIGGGFGGMAYFLLRDHPHLKYVDLDLPENAALTAYYLITNFPDKKIGLFGEVDLEAPLESYDAVILPSFVIKSFDDNSIDVCFNSYSLAEMSKETVEMYADEIGRICKRYVLHVNHNRESIAKADQFGFENRGFELVYKAQALWNFGRRFDPDEYEYLYQRVLST